jgi:Adenylate and Guanylate cyclase catalytic domain
MELLADRDPEEAGQLLDPVLERMMDAVHRYEGTVNQVMGDGIMVLFGAPIGHEDHAVRACYAALAMQGAVKQYAAEVQRTRGVPIHIRVGLNAEEVVVRSIGSDLHMDYTVLQSLLGDDASLEPLKARLIERTQGNPFFLEESVQTLVETQGLVGDPGAYRLPRVLPSIQMPATVQAVLAARIDRLPPGEKQLLQTAAVIGTEVPLALLQAMAEVPEAPLRLGLTHLQAAEFLYETRLFPAIEYTFKHALTQQVAYGSLLQERRRMLHARIVEALEALAGDRWDDQVERLAHHLAAPGEGETGAGGGAVVRSGAAPDRSSWRSAKPPTWPPASRGSPCLISW